MSNYLLDTNVIIDYLRKDEDAAQFLSEQKEIVISCITVGEIYQGVRDQKELRFIKEFLQYVVILPVDESVSQRMVTLLEKYMLSSGLQILDVFIAATSMPYNLTLLTSNIKHFKAIEELKIKKW